MRRTWKFEKTAKCGKVIETATVVYYGGITLCFIGDKQRRFTSPDAATTQLGVEGFSKVEDAKNKRL